VQRGLKELGFACRRWDSLLTQDWGAGDLRSVPGCFAPLCHPHIELLPITPNTCRAQCCLCWCIARPSHNGNAAGNCGRS